MLNSIGPTELLLLFVIALLILGPERLPKVATQIGRWVGKARRTANHLRYQLEREIALSEIDKSPRKPAKPAPPKDAEPDPSTSRSGGEPGRAADAAQQADSSERGGAESAPPSGAASEPAPPRAGSEPARPSVAASEPAPPSRAADDRSGKPETGSAGEARDSKTPSA